jgi:hypothetical protein
MDDAPANPYALHMACLSNEYDTVKRLLDEGAPLSTRWEGRSPLTLAVAGDPSDLRLVDLLLRRGAGPRSYPLDIPGSEDDAFDAALGCTTRRTEILMRLLRRTTAPLCGAQRIFDAAALFSVDIMREVLLCRTGSAEQETRVADFLGVYSCLDDFYAAVVTHGLPAVEAAVLPLMVDVIGSSILRNAWGENMGDYDSDVHKWDLPEAHAALARQLAHSLASLDLDYLIAIDTDARIIDELVELGVTHSCINPSKPARRHIPRLFSAIRASSPDALHAALDGLSDADRVAALNASDDLGQCPLARAVCRLDAVMVDALVHEGAAVPFDPDGHYYVPSSCLLAGKRVDSFVLLNDMYTLPELVIAALSAVHDGLQATYTGSADDRAATVDAQMETVNCRAVDVLRTLLTAHARACGIGAQLDLVVVRREQLRSKYSPYEAAASEVIHAVCKTEQTFARSSRHALLRFSATELCSDPNTRLCAGHTPLSLLFEYLYDEWPQVDPFATRDAERLLPLFIRDVDTSIEWRKLLPATDALHRDTERGGEPDVCSAGTLLAYHLRVPERLLKWQASASLSSGRSTLTSYAYWPRLAELSKRDWSRRYLNELLDGSRKVGAWWLQPQFRAVLTSDLSGAVPSPRSCRCALCQSGPQAAYELQLAAAAYVADASQRRRGADSGLTYYTCAAVHISGAELRAAWPALLHAAVFYRDANTNTNDFPDCYMLEELWGGDPSYFACRALWFNVFAAAVRLRDADALRLAAWIVTAGNGDYVTGVARTTGPIGGAMEAAVPLVAGAVVRRLLPTRCFADVMDAARYADGVAFARGIQVDELQSGGLLLAAGRTRRACVVLRAGATTERDHLVGSVSGYHQYALGENEIKFWPDTVCMAPRLHAAFGAAGWARRKHAVAAHARARWAQWAAAARQADAEAAGGGGSGVAASEAAAI